jgi:hypothetical protein
MQGRTRKERKMKNRYTVKTFLSRTAILRLHEFLRAGVEQSEISFEAVSVDGDDTIFYGGINASVSF